jgi:integrase
MQNPQPELVHAIATWLGSDDVRAKLLLFMWVDASMNKLAMIMGPVLAGGIIVEERARGSLDVFASKPWRAADYFTVKLAASWGRGRPSILPASSARRSRFRGAFRVRRGRPPSAQRCAPLRGAVRRHVLGNDGCERVVASCELTTLVGRRDRAVLLLLACLGLRAGDVAALQLSDLDWQAGIVQVAGKNRRPTRLPLPQESGDAILATSNTAPSASPRPVRGAGSLDRLVTRPIVMPRDRGRNPRWERLRSRSPLHNYGCSIRTGTDGKPKDH